MSWNIAWHSLDNRKGQVTILILIVLPTFVWMVHATLKLSRKIERKIKLQNGVDAALYVHTQTLASGLNEISNLNLKLKECLALLRLVQAGKIITGNPGFVITESFLKRLIQAIAKQQDLIKKIYPAWAYQKAMIIARKNETPHVILYPLTFSYSIRRTWTIEKLPGPYVLSETFDQHKEFSMDGFFYKAKESAHAKTTLSGKDLYSETWHLEWTPSKPMWNGID
ncbi:MAG: hypothetical protein HY390_06290 [Deltaproteobacteria bacterium]|nr:hypothetical protein [Deltaproteobacteria bacterium]